MTAQPSDGFCDERFAPLQDLFLENLENGVDTGACLAATLGGETVVDLWGGYSDRKFEQPWAENTMVNVFSTSKVMVIIATLLMHDRGVLDLDAPIATYWPEFAQNGKDTITARDVLVHRSGLPGFGQALEFETLHDWDRVIEIIETAKLWHEPRARTYYHPTTYGFILGEVIRRISGLPFDEFFRTELAEPLGADFHFGISDPSEHARVAGLWPVDPADAPEEVLDPVMTEVGDGSWLSPERKAAVIPSGNGIGNARSIARLGAMMAMGGTLDGRRYLSREVIEEAATEQSYEDDHLMGWCRYGLGFGLDSESFVAPTATTFHWGGYGGSFSTMDLATGLSVAFAPNRLLLGDGPRDEDRLLRYFATIGEVSRSLG
jgi:CubicO group peptidase (beta-lactamase class C family)